MYMKQYIARVQTIPGDRYQKHLLAFKKKMDRWFGFEVEMPRVLFVQSRKEYDKLFGYKTESWQVARTENGAIFILDPKIYTKESDHKDIKSFWLVLQHEYVHLYYRKLTETWDPRWINEGLACYLAGQIKKVPEKEILVDVNQFFDRGGQWVYGVGYFWVNYLIKKYGKAKLLKLIKTINVKITKKKFETKFKQIYGFRLDKKSLATAFSYSLRRR